MEKQENNPKSSHPYNPYEFPDRAEAVNKEREKRLKMTPTERLRYHDERLAIILKLAGRRPDVDFIDEGDRFVADRIVIDPKVMMGKPVIMGTRLTVEYILDRLNTGSTFGDLLQEYPGLVEEDIRACQGFFRS